MKRTYTCRCCGVEGGGTLFRLPKDWGVALYAEGVARYARCPVCKPPRPTAVLCRHRKVPTVHILRYGVTLCGNEWRLHQSAFPDDRWIREERAADATCPGCVDALRAVPKGGGSDGR